VINVVIGFSLGFDEENNMIKKTHVKRLKILVKVI